MKRVDMHTNRQDSSLEASNGPAHLACFGACGPLRAIGLEAWLGSGRSRAVKAPAWLGEAILPLTLGFSNGVCNKGCCSLHEALLVEAPFVAKPRCQP